MSETWQTLHERALALSFRGGPDAVEAAHAALKVAADDEGDESEAACVCSRTLAGAYLAGGDIPRALRFSKQAVRIGERISAAKEQIAEDLSFVAYAHSALAEPEEARQAAERSLAFLEGAAPTGGTAKVLGNLAAAYGNLRDNARALELCRQAEAMLEHLAEGTSDAALEAQVDLGRACINAAKNARALGSFADATEALRRSLENLAKQRASGLRPKEGDVEALSEEWRRLWGESGSTPDEETLAAIAALLA